MGVGARFRATEGRVAAANGLDVQERWVDIASPTVQVRLLGVEVSATRCCSSTASRHQGSGWRRWPAVCLGVAICWSTFRARLSPPYLWQGAPLREQAVNVIAGVLDGLGIDQVTLVGNSLGGLFSLWFAHDRRRVRRGYDRPARGRDPGLARDLTMGVLAAPVLGRVATWMAAALAATRGPLRPAAIGRSPRRARFRRHRRPAPPLAAAARPGSIVSVAAAAAPRGSHARPENNLTDAELRGFTVPLLFVWPDDDVFLGPAAGKPSVDKIPALAS